MKYSLKFMLAIAFMINLIHAKQTHISIDTANSLNNLTTNICKNVITLNIYLTQLRDAVISPGLAIPSIDLYTNAINAIANDLNNLKSQFILNNHFDPIAINNLISTIFNDITNLNNSINTYQNYITTPNPSLNLPSQSYTSTINSNILTNLANLYKTINTAIEPLSTPLAPTLTPPLTELSLPSLANMVDPIQGSQEFINGSNFTISLIFLDADKNILNLSSRYSIVSGEGDSTKIPQNAKFVSATTNIEQNARNGSAPINGGIDMAPIDPMKSYILTNHNIVNSQRTEFVLTETSISTESLKKRKRKMR